MSENGPSVLELPRDLGAPGRARRWLAESFGSELAAEELERATLIASELVTNAVIHGRGKIMLSGEVNEYRLLMEVVDEGQGFERVLRQHDFDAVGGWGLAIVDAEASRWGIHEGTTHVWFELERRGPRLGPSKSPLGSETDRGDD
jgi:anti-sigma regulatory factor (Ser/Thr protein kinase)